MGVLFFVKGEMNMTQFLTSIYLKVIVLSAAVVPLVDKCSFNQ